MRIGLEAARRVIDADTGEHRQRLGAGFGATDPAMQSEPLHHLAADGHRRIERDHRLLEDHADMAAANGAHRFLGECRQILAAEQDAPTCMADRLGQETENGARQGRLAAARFADQGEDLSGRDVDIGAGDDVADPGGGEDQLLDAEHRGSVHQVTCAMRGSRRSRIASPRRLVESSASEMKRPGKKPSQAAEAA
jgi:hypothetical protein